jgi:hypothetical protein
MPRTYSRSACPGTSGPAAIPSSPLRLLRNGRGVAFWLYRVLLPYLLSHSPPGPEGGGILLLQRRQALGGILGISAAGAAHGRLSNDSRPGGERSRGPPLSTGERRFAQARACVTLSRRSPDSITAHAHRGQPMPQHSGPPEDYLRECSNTSLRYFEMSKLEHVANLRRELAVLLDEMMEESALALFARWMLERRSIPAGASRNGSDAKSAESRRARSLLTDFITGALLPPGTRPGSNGQGGKLRGEDHAPVQTASAAGLECRNGDGPHREHAPERRRAPRSERQIERRRARAERDCGRAIDGAP